VPVSDASGRYTGGPGLVWADARLDHAAREMRALAGDAKRWHALSAAGLAFAPDKLCQPISAAPYHRFLIGP
jgi:hypothetical protein